MFEGHGCMNAADIAARVQARYWQAPRLKGARRLDAGAKRRSKAAFQTVALPISVGDLGAGRFLRYWRYQYARLL
jgi:hypothetical protein